MQHNQRLSSNIAIARDYVENLSGKHSHVFETFHACLRTLLLSTGGRLVFELQNIINDSKDRVNPARDDPVFPTASRTQGLSAPGGPDSVDCQVRARVTERYEILSSILCRRASS